MADVDETVKRAEGLGAKALAPPFDVMDAGRMAVVQDPTGAVFQVWQSKNHIGARILEEPGALCWSELTTRDTKAAESFYTGLFGWTAKHGAASTQTDYTEFSNQGKAAVGMMADAGGRAVVLDVVLSGGGLRRQHRQGQGPWRQHHGAAARYSEDGSIRDSRRSAGRDVRGLRVQARLVLSSGCVLQQPPPGSRARSQLGFAVVPDDAQGTRPAHGVFEQLEPHVVADAEIVEGRARLQIAAMEVHLAQIGQTDEPVAVADQDFHNPTGHELAAQIGGPQRLTRPRWQTFTSGAVEILRAHIRTENRGRASAPPRSLDAYQRGSDRRRESPPPKPPPECAGFGRASLTARPRPPS